MLGLYYNVVNVTCALQISFYVYVYVLEYLQEQDSPMFCRFQQCKDCINSQRSSRAGRLNDTVTRTMQLYRKRNNRTKSTKFMSLNDVYVQPVGVS